MIYKLLQKFKEYLKGKCLYEQKSKEKPAKMSSQRQLFGKSKENLEIATQNYPGKSHEKSWKNIQLRKKYTDKFFFFLLR